MDPVKFRRPVRKQYSSRATLCKQYPILRNSYFKLNLLVYFKNESLQKKFHVEFLRFVIYLDVRLYRVW